MGTGSCVFCSIVHGDVPARLVLDDGRHVAFHDVSPAAPHHLLVVPREHYEDLDDFTARRGDGDGMLRFVVRLVEQEGLAGRYRLLTNVGAPAGQTVPHLHWHVLSGDGVDAF